MAYSPSYFTPIELETLYGIPAKAWRRWAYRRTLRANKSAAGKLLIPKSEVDRILHKHSPRPSLYQDFQERIQQLKI